MAVRVTEGGRTISLVVARQQFNGREIPLTMGKVAEAGDVFSDDQLSETVIAYAKAGERGLEYVSEDEVVGDEDPSASKAERTVAGPEASEPVPGYDDLNSKEAQAVYESEEDPVKQQAILEYELSNQNRAWAKHAQEGSASL